MSSRKEKIINDYPKIIPYDNYKKILDQMEKNICKVKLKKSEEQGTGFFCRIPFPDIDHMLPVLITNNHIIDETILNNEKEEIDIYIKNVREFKNFDLKERKTYTSNKDKYDITIIELKNKDNINNFLDLDDRIIDDIFMNKNSNDDFVDVPLYIIQYPKGQLSVSFGIFKSIYEDKKYKFCHKCSTEGGASGSPILNLNNNKIVGIHSEGDIKDNFNIGILFNNAIKEFISKYFKENSLQRNQIYLTQKQNIYYSEMLKHLIRNNFLQKEFCAKSHFSNILEGYLIKIDTINKLKKIYSINQIIQILKKSNNASKEMNYQNVNKNYDIIAKYLNKEQENYINTIKQIEEQGKYNFNNTEITSTTRNNNLTYFKDFELIDKEFASFLIKKFINKINLLSIKYMIIKNNFIFLIKSNNSYIYEIAKPNNKSILEIEYLLEILNSNFTCDINLINDYVYKLLYNNDITKLISLGNPIILGNNEVFINIHSLNDNSTRIKNEKREESYQNIRRIDDINNNQEKPNNLRFSNVLAKDANFVNKEIIILNNYDIFVGLKDNIEYLIYCCKNNSNIKIMRIQDKYITNDLKGHRAEITVIRYYAKNYREDFILSCDVNKIAIVWDIQDNFNKKFIINSKYTSYIFDSLLLFNIFGKDYILLSNWMENEFSKLYEFNHNTPFKKFIYDTNCNKTNYMIPWEYNNKYYIIECCYHKISINNLLEDENYAKLSMEPEGNHCCGYIYNKNYLCVNDIDNNLIRVWNLVNKEVHKQISYDSKIGYGIIPWNNIHAIFAYDGCFNIVDFEKGKTIKKIPLKDEMLFILGIKKFKKNYEECLICSCKDNEIRLFAI